MEGGASTTTHCFGSVTGIRNDLGKEGVAPDGRRGGRIRAGLWDVAQDYGRVLVGFARQARSPVKDLMVQRN